MENTVTHSDSVKKITLSGNELILGLDGRNINISLTVLKEFLGVQAVSGIGGVVPNEAYVPGQGSAEAPAIYFSVPGTYPGFGGVVLTDPLNVISWDGSVSVAKGVPIEIPEPDLSGLVEKTNIVGQVKSNQIFDKSNVQFDQAVANLSGEYQSIVGAISTSDIPMKEGETHVTISGMEAPGGGLTRFAVFLDVDHEPILPTETMSGLTSKTLAIGEGKYLRACIKLPVNSMEVLDTVMINYGQVAMPYEPYDEVLLSVDGKRIPEASGVTIGEVEIAIDEKTEPLVNKNSIVSVVISNQKFNKLSYISDTGISSTGTYTDSPGSAMTNILPVPDEVTQVTISGLYPLHNKRVIFFNESNVRVGDVILSTAESFTVDKPAGARFIQVWFKTGAAPVSHIDTFVLNWGSSPLPIDQYTEEVAGIDGKKVFNSSDLPATPDEPEGIVEVTKRIDERYLNDFRYKELTAKNVKMSNAVNSLRKIKSADSGELTFSIPNSTGVEQRDVNLILNLHYGSQIGDISANDLFMNGLCNKDFSDIRFLDINDNLLDMYKAYSGNYETAIDSNLKVHNLQLSDGSLAGCDKSSTGIFISENNAVTWTNIIPEGQLIGIGLNDDVFYQLGTDLRKATKVSNYLTSTVVIPGYTGATWRTQSFKIDDAGNIYMGAYQSAFDVKLWKSTNGGDSFSVIYESPAQHIHSIVLDTSAIPNVIYVNQDGANGNPVTYPRTVVSYDRGATFTELDFGDFTPDYGVLYAEGDTLVGGGEGEVKGYPSIYRKEGNRVRIIVNNSQNVHEMQGLKGAIYAVGNSHGFNKYARIFRSNDKGKSFGVAYDSGLIEDRDMSAGLRYGSYGVINPSGSEDEHLVWSSLDSYRPELMPIRVYEGGEHYQGAFYVKLPVFPASGTTIKVGYGYLTEDVEGEVFNEVDSNDGLVLHLPLNEYGDTVFERQELQGFNVTGSEWIGGVTKRFSFLVPYKAPVVTAGVSIADNRGMTFDWETYSLNFNKGFTVNFWFQASRPWSQGQELKQFIFGRLGVAGNELFFYRQNANRLGIRFGGQELTLTNFFGITNMDNFNQITIQITAESVPKLRAFINGNLSGELTLTGFNNAMSFSNWILGGKNGTAFGVSDVEDGYITDFKVYNRLLSDSEIRYMFEGGNLLKP